MGRSGKRQGGVSRRLVKFLRKIAKEMKESSLKDLMALRERCKEEDIEIRVLLDDLIDLLERSGKGKRRE